jgi:HEAT repeat protein
MFENYKVRKLITELISIPSGQSLGHIKSLKRYGKGGLDGITEAFKGGKIVSKDLVEYLNAFYDKTNTDLFIELLSDSKEDVRSAAKEILFKKGSFGSIPELVETLKTGNFLQKRGVSELLKRLGSATIVDKVIPLLNDKSREIKGLAMEILGDIGNNKATRHIIPLLSSSDWWVRKRGVDALSKIKDPASLKPLLEKLDLERDLKIKAVIIETLGEIGDSGSAAKVLQCIKENDMIVRQMAVEAVQKTGDASLVEQIISILKGADVNVRRAGVEILQKLKDPKATGILIERLSDLDWWVREIATDALAEMGDKDNNGRILTLFKSGDENIRRAAAEYFTRVPSEEAFDELVERLKDNDWWVREKVIEALGRFGDERAVEKIAELINDHDVRRVVPGALGEIGGDKAIVYLGDLMEDPDRTIRLSALRAMQKLGAKSALTMIKGMVKDNDAEIRDTALQIVKEMTGHYVKADQIIAAQEKEAEMGGGTISSKVVGGSSRILTETILVLDLVGSTEISEKYGDDFALKVTSRLVDISNPIASKNRARFIKSTGDGFLMTFSEPENAILFAVDISRAVEESNMKFPDNESIDIRIAINLGETRVDTKGDRLGSAVNMTFRVDGVKPEGLISDDGGMEAGEMPLVNRILVTEAVKGEIDKLSGYDAKYIGFFDLKGISGRHRIFQMVYK